MLVLSEAKTTLFARRRSGGARVGASLPAPGWTHHLGGKKRRRRLFAMNPGRFRVSAAATPDGRRTCPVSHIQRGGSGAERTQGAAPAFHFRDGSTPGSGSCCAPVQQPFTPSTADSFEADLRPVPRHYISPRQRPVGRPRALRSPVLPS